MNKNLIFAVVIAVAIIGGALYFTRAPYTPSPAEAVQQSSVVNLKDGTAKTKSLVGPLN